MPRIDAPTVAEHHSKQRAALLAAGTDLLATRGIEAVTPAAVGAAAGLARSSVYQYFDSSPALLTAIVEVVFPRATEQLLDAVGRVDTPAARVRAYVHLAIRHAQDPTHRSVHSLTRADLPEACRARLTELHHQLTSPLREALADLDVPDVDLTADLVLGLLRAAVQAVVAGRPGNQVEGRLLSLLDHGALAVAHEPDERGDRPHRSPPTR